MEISCIVQAPELLDKVKALWRRNSRTLGPFPAGAFEEHTAKGQILVAKANGDCLGYVLFRDVVTRNQVAITHLCVDESARDRGIAGQLVGSLRQLRAHTRGIGLWCRRDYEAANLWPKLGFVAHSERPGRGRNNEPLVYWWLDHGHPDLLDLAGPERPEDVLVLALDANVFFDLEGQDRQIDFESRGLLANWLQPQVELCVTRELLTEIQRHPDAEERYRLRTTTGQYRLLKGDGTTFTKLIKSLDEVLGPATSESQESDRRQLAWAVVGDADHFITRDGGVLD